MSRLIEEMIRQNSKNGQYELPSRQQIGGDTRVGDKVFATSPKVNKFSVDSEVLLSYIYRKLGLSNPQAIPIKSNGKSGVLTEKIEHGKDYIHDEMNNYRYGYMYFDNLHSASQIHTFWEKEMMDSYIKISLADMMFWIQDRYPAKLYVKRGGNLGMKEVVPTGFVYPSFLVDYFDYYSAQPFYNGVYEKEETRAEYKERLKIFNFKQYMTPKEFLDICTKIDIKRCANEIFEQYNYRINPKFVDFVDRIFTSSREEFKEVEK